MYLGSTEGAIFFHPDDVVDDPTPPYVVITDFRLSQESVLPSPDGPLTTDVSVATHIQLKHNQNAIGIEYAGIHFREPEKNQYAYKLEGFNEDWVNAGTPQGNPDLEPPFPTFPTGSQIGTPDLVLTMEEAHNVVGNNQDDLIRDPKQLQMHPPYT